MNQPRTLGWNAPEVTPAPPTAASDLFALGLLAFFALSGSPWYSAQRSSVASSAERPRTASERARAYGGDIPAGLDAWFERALAHEPRDRFSNASDMAQAFVRALDDARSNPPSAVGPLSATVPVPQKSPFAHSNPRPSVAAAARFEARSQRPYGASARRDGASPCAAGGARARERAGAAPRLPRSPRRRRPLKVLAP